MIGSNILSVNGLKSALLDLSAASQSINYIRKDTTWGQGCGFSKIWGQWGLNPPDAAVELYAHLK